MTEEKTAKRPQYNYGRVLESKQQEIFSLHQLTQEITTDYSYQWNDV
jgi:hypothetical protein